MSISSVTGDMSQDLGRSPTPREIAEKLGVTVEEVMEGIESANAYSTLSLDAGDNNDEGGGNSMLDSLGDGRRGARARGDPRVDQAADRAAAARARSGSCCCGSSAG